MYFIYHKQNLKFFLKDAVQRIIFLKAFQLWASQAFAIVSFIICSNQIPGS